MRHTKQKENILKFLKSVKTHPTADEVFYELRKIMPNISLGTVYRNLEYFEKRGEIISLPGKVKRFDADTSEHQHFFCEKCGKVFDVYDKHNFDFDNIKKNNPYIKQINSFSVFYKGVCENCAK